MNLKDVVFASSDKASIESVFRNARDRGACTFEVRESQSDGARAFLGGATVGRSGGFESIVSAVSASCRAMGESRCHPGATFLLVFFDDQGTQIDGIGVKLQNPLD